MKSSKSKDALSQTKKSLRQLHKLGLYDPKNPRKNPTRYGKSLIKKFSDLLGAKPKAQAIKIPKSEAAALAQSYRVKRTAKGAVAIVPKAGGMKATYSRKDKTIIRKIGDYRLVPYPDRMILMNGGFPKLRKNEAVVVRIGNSYKSYYNRADLSRDMLEYNPANSTLWQFPYIGTSKRAIVDENEDDGEDYGHLPTWLVD